ncbi:EmrB/QacA subfamily drug resistance transporter [Kribbella orskensis]|uniref:EmrB/QacA subfamily drug resistance transporter n=1 Tax=Kribbella orskensis TaxID=2512216 RepID=A0ABY2BK80_9ACTN|nr:MULTISPECIES: DHA2 family efflux MFS transporter permease subunit [Kribbella]TCN40101.1 EmrB/QacA subfamily drug resistance transporter [Kribbella sp. VKM Ac-2500]TCO22721.1 EmrB/QacA subfamily drug resistance transporter [Kribbella orskensis]
METALDPRRWWALGAMSVSLIVVGLDLTVLNVALPTLATELDASISQLQWFANAYTLVLAALLLPAGLLGDRFGQKRLLIGALVMFGAASAACAFASSPGELIVFRAALGIGAAFLIPLSMSLINILFAPEERGRAITLWVMANSLGIPLGPVLGGWLLDHYRWGSIFLINVPLVLIGVVAVALLVPAIRGHRSGRIDVLGIGLSGAGLVALTYGFVSAGERGWGDPLTLGGIALGLVLLAAFGTWQTRAVDPLVDLGLFKSREFTWGTVLATVASFALMGLLFVLPQLFQAVQGADALQTGLRLLPIIGGLLVGAKVAERLVVAVGARVTVAVGFVLMFGGLVAGAFTGVGDSYGYAAIWVSVVGLSIGFTLPPVMEMATGALSAERSGAGSGLIQALRQVGGTIGVALLGTVLNSAYRDKLDVAGLPPAVADAARDSASGAVAIAAKTGSSSLAQSAREAFVHGMNATLWTCCAVSVLGLLLAVAYLPRRSAVSVDEGPAEVVTIKS